jgi:putative membrane protein
MPNYASEIALLVGIKFARTSERPDMNDSQSPPDSGLNKDLILREHLAVERTEMANYRTLLSFLRTGLYFLIAGSTLDKFVNSSFWNAMGLPFILAGIILMVFGIVFYLRGRMRLLESRKQIGAVKGDFILSITRKNPK